MLFPPPPNIPDYISWIRTIMQVPFDVLPDSSPYIEYSYDMAITWTNMYLNLANPAAYTQCVYNAGGNFLVNIAQDNPNLNPPDDTYWSDLRNALGVNSFAPGLVNAAEDQGTSARLQLLASMENLTIGDLQMLKTPWGRIALGIAQSVGSLWGITP